MSPFLTNIARITTNQVYKDNLASGSNTPRLPLKKRFSSFSLLGFFFLGGGGLKRKNLQISPFTSKFSWLLSLIISFHLKQTKNNPLQCPDVSMQARNT
jgi:hypothetical protein